MSADKVTKAHGAKAITPNDSETIELPRNFIGFYIGGTGNLAVKMQDDSDHTFLNVQAGAVYPFAIKQIKLTGTTASGIIMLTA